MSIQDFNTDTFNDGEWEYRFESELHLHPNAMRTLRTPNTIHVYIRNEKEHLADSLVLVFRSQYKAAQGMFETIQGGGKISPEVLERIKKHLGRELKSFWTSL